MADLSRLYYRVRYVHGVSGLLEQGRHFFRRRARDFPVDTFDREWGIDTFGRDTGATFAASDPTHTWLASRSNPTQPVIFHELIPAAGLDYPRWTFLDAGCGKGRAVLLATLYPWRRILGVDFSRELIEQAQVNLARWSHPERRCHDVSFVWSDMTAVALPNDPLAIFLFNPCAAPVIARFAEHVARHRQPVTVLYHKPVAGQAWIDAGFPLVRRGAEWAIYRHS